MREGERKGNATRKGRGDMRDGRKEGKGKKKGKIGKKEGGKGEGKGERINRVEESRKSTRGIKGENRKGKRRKKIKGEGI